MTEIVRLSQLDGKIPNIALMKLAAWHRARGDIVHYVTGARCAERGPDEPHYDCVYGSAIFKFSAPLIERFKNEFPDAIIGGTGSGNAVEVEDIIGPDFGERFDYDAAPAGFTASIGFTQRGCRLKCRFCVVPAKEGKPRVVSTIADIWRGAPWPRHIHLLDNDFFGQPEAAWRARLEEIREGGFKVCFNQGLNVRLITPAAAEAVASIEYRDDSFTKRRLYTAWDNLKDEAIFFRGVDRLGEAGVPAKHLMVYMLVGFDPAETWERIFHRFNRMVERGILPYPMVFDRSRYDLRRFQRWVVTGLYRSVPFSDYDTSKLSRWRSVSRQTDNPRLVELAHEINVRLQKAEDHRLAAALRLAEAKAECRKAGVSFKAWAATAITSIGYSEATKLAKIGAAPDPAKALEDFRKVRSSREKARRDSKVGHVANYITLSSPSRPSPVDVCATAVRRIVLETLQALPATDRSELLARIRGEMDKLEQAAGQAVLPL